MSVDNEERQFGRLVYDVNATGGTELPADMSTDLGSLTFSISDNEVCEALRVYIHTRLAPFVKVDVGTDVYTARFHELELGMWRAPGRQRRGRRASGAGTDPEPENVDLRTIRSAEIEEGDVETDSLDDHVRFPDSNLL